ncbi:hypothetical protein QWJ90_04500 [Microbacterium oryzae]|uniref:hypothetical protein n=1 Tax=Microbacterium oryzae TaxID=743009 RepID=UPI0025B26A60|nr:hypothetical protein [Microbacterium oryzae]MDN3310181.1 hypothetical protein [Microbacterium oryzae]
MNMPSTTMSGTRDAAPIADLAAVEARLSERAIPFRRLDVGADAAVVVSSYGARVYGPFFRAGVSESWLPSAFGDADAFAALHADEQWNLGGDRVWIGPEIEYMIPDRDRYWDTYDMPSALDPGEHTLSRGPDEPTMHRHLRVRPHLSGGITNVDLEIRVRPAPDRLRHLGGIARSVEYAGYATEFTMGRRALRRPSSRGCSSKSTPVAPRSSPARPACASPTTTSRWANSFAAPAAASRSR